MSETFTAPDTLPERWFGAYRTDYALRYTEMRPFDSALVVAGDEALTPSAGDPWTENHPLHVGTVLFILAAAQDGESRQAFRAAYSKDFYPAPPDVKGMIWGAAAIPLVTVAPEGIKQGDLLVRRTVNGAVEIGLVTREPDANGWVWVQEYRHQGGGHRLIRSYSRHSSWRPIDGSITTVLMRARVWTNHHPLTEREDTTVSTDTPSVNETVNTAAVPDTLCKDPAHEGIVVQLQEKDTTLASVRSALNRARAEHLDDIRKIGEAFWEEAERRDWCDDAKDFIVAVNESLSNPLTVPERAFTVEVEANGETTITVNDSGLTVDVEVEWKAVGEITVHATTEEAAQEMVEEDSDYVSDNFGDLTFEIVGVEGADVDDEFTLTQEVESSVDAWSLTGHSVTDVGAA